MTPLELFLGLLASVVVSGFLVLSTVTLGVSILKRRADRREERIRKGVRTQLFEHQSQEDPDWEGWVDTLSSAERTQLESVLERYLRNVSGSDRRLYQSLAETLDMGQRANAELDRKRTVPRMRALARLSLLSSPITRTRLFNTCLDSPGTRQAAARLVYERRHELEHPAIVGTVLLLWDSQKPLTTHGLDTLYRLNDGDPRPLLLRASQDAREWSTTLLEQVCVVLGRCQVTGNETRFDWVFPLFEHDEPRVRAAAILVFSQQEWKSQLRSKVPFRSLLKDDDRRVRYNTYQVLTKWGDEDARQLLEWAVVNEPDSRCRLLAVRALASVEPNPTKSAEWPTPTWNWVRAEQEATTADRTRSTVGPEVLS